MNRSKTLNRRAWLKTSLAVSAGLAVGGVGYSSFQNPTDSPTGPEHTIQSLVDSPNSSIPKLHDLRLDDIPSFPNIRMVGHWNQQHGNDQYCITTDCDFDNPPKMMMGVDQHSCSRQREATWQDQHPVPWESFAYGEYIGPHRTPHVPLYRVRVNDQIRFVFHLTRELSAERYRLNVGDSIDVFSAVDPDLIQKEITVISDGTVSLNLIGSVSAAGKTIEQFQKEINELYKKQVNNPSVTVRGVKTNTPLQDVRDAVDARQGSGGQSQDVTVSPDGTIQLPVLSSPVHAIGLSLEELGREVNARYREVVPGIKASPILIQRAPRVAYVLGEVATPGRIELVGPTSAIQAISVAGSWNPGANLRQIVVFRRDCNWRLMATRLDLAGAVHGYQPRPSDEIWLRDGDIVLVPKQPIQRVADAVDLYFTRTLYAILPNQGFTLTFDGTNKL